jgi:hypothetical protein
VRPEDVSRLPPPWPNLGEGTNLRMIVLACQRQPKSDQLTAAPSSVFACRRHRAGPNLGEGANLRMIVLAPGRISGGAP